MSFCAVNGCMASTHPAHYIPKKIEFFKKWVSILKLDHIPYERRKGVRICDAHFSSAMKRRKPTFGMSLSRKAYPDRNLPTDPPSDAHTEEITESEQFSDTFLYNDANPNLINLENVDKLCRICLHAKEETKPLYNDPTLVLRIELISNITVEPRLNFPSKICYGCIKNINRCFMFRQLIITNDNLLNENDSKPNKEDLKPGLSEIEEILMEMNTEPLKLIKSDPNDGWDTCVDEESGNSSEKDLPSTAFMNAIQLTPVKSPTFDDETIDDEKNEVFVCDICKKEFGDRKELQTHQKKHTSLKTTCKVCGQAVLTIAMKNHLKRKHPRKNDENLTIQTRSFNNRVLKCSICGITTKDKVIYKNHLQTHAKRKVRKQKCNICGILCRASYLTKHYQEHKETTLYSCENCTSSFSTYSTLKMHLRGHKTEKQFKCEICDEKFDMEQDLSNHINLDHDF